jgi:ABC-type Mn2+/Zn2+ transport system ATPase subunit
MEPSEGLDPVAIEHLLQTLVTRAAEGVAIFFSSHQILKSSASQTTFAFSRKVAYWLTPLSTTCANFIGGLS